MLAFSWLVSFRRCLHDSNLSIFDFERTIFRAVASAARGVDDKSTNKAFTRPQLVFCDLVTERTGNAILRQSIHAVIGPRSQVREDFGFLSLVMRLVSRHWHMTNRTLILNGLFGFGMIDRFPTHARLPVRISRGVRHHGGPP